MGPSVRGAGIVKCTEPRWVTDGTGPWRGRNRGPHAATTGVVRGMPGLHWEDHGSDYVYGLDWTVGAVCTVVAAAALVASVFWARRLPSNEHSTGARAVVVLASVATLAVAALLAFGVARSRLFEGILGRRSSTVIEHFWWSMMIQIGMSVAAGVSVATMGLRRARHGVDGSAALRHLCLAGVATVVLGYGVWLRPGEGMAVLKLEHRFADFRGTRRWIHDSAAYVPQVEATLSGWRVVEVQSWRVDGAVKIEARAVRGPLSSTKRFLIPMVADNGDARLPLAIGRQWRFDEVALEPADADADALVITPWDDRRPPRVLAIDVVAERRIEGRHLFDVRRTVDGTSELLEVYASGGVWWARVPRRIRERSLVEHWLGRCASQAMPPADSVRAGSLVCHSSHRRGWQLRQIGTEQPRSG